MEAHLNHDLANHVRAHTEGTEVAELQAQIVVPWEGLSQHHYPALHTSPESL